MATLPLIYTLNTCDRATKKKIIRTFKKYNEDRKKVNDVIEIVNNSGGIEYATKRMLEYRTEALDILKKFPESDARQSLEGLVMYTTERLK